LLFFFCNFGKENPPRLGKNSMKKKNNIRVGVRVTFYLFLNLFLSVE